MKGIYTSIIFLLSSPLLAGTGGSICTCTIKKDKIINNTICAYEGISTPSWVSEKIFICKDKKIAEFKIGEDISLISTTDQKGISLSEYKIKETGKIVEFKRISSLNADLAEDEKNM